MVTENDVIPMVLLVNMHVILGGLIFSCSLAPWVQGNSNGPLVPMLRFVPIENNVIPMVLLVNMHLIKGT